VQLSITPAHASPTGAIVLAGLVQEPIPPRGVVVGLLVHYRGQREPFRTPRTDCRGRFTGRYEFQGGVGRFAFRAEVFAGEASCPYARGTSATVNVRTG
jgi:hypothetical protein